MNHESVEFYFTYLFVYCIGKEGLLTANNRFNTDRNVQESFVNRRRSSETFYQMRICYDSKENKTQKRGEVPQSRRRNNRALNFEQMDTDEREERACEQGLLHLNVP